MMAEPSTVLHDRWIALLVTALAGVLAAIQSSALIVALTTLIRDLNSDFGTILWVMLAFLVAVGAVAPILGFFSDSGVKGIRCFLFNIGFAIFGLGSLLAGFSQPKYTAVDLVIYRAIMGVGAGFIFSNSAPILADKFAPFNQVGLSQGLWGISFAMGSVIGPLVGGGVLVAGWQWVFWFNVPFAFVGCLFGFWKVKDDPIVLEDGKEEQYVTVRSVMQHFDYLGCLLCVAAQIFMFIAILSALFATPTLGGPAVITGFSVACAVCFVAFFIWEFIRRSNHPFFSLRLFESRDFSVLVLGTILLSLARSCLTFGFIFYFQGPGGLDPFGSGIAVIPIGLGLLLAGFFSGRMCDTIGYRNLCVVGPLVTCAAMIGLNFIQTNTNYWLCAFGMFVAGIGQGLYNSPSNALGVLCIKPTQRGESSGIRMMVTMLCNGLSITICFSQIVGSLAPQLVYEIFITGGANNLDPTVLEPFMAGLRNVFWIIFGCNLGVSITSALLPNRPILAPGLGKPVPIDVDKNVPIINAPGSNIPMNQINSPLVPPDASAAPNQSPASNKSTLQQGTAV